MEPILEQVEDDTKDVSGTGMCGVIVLGVAISIVITLGFLFVIGL